MKSGDVVIGLLPGAVETKARPAVVIASDSYLLEHHDVLLGIVTTRPPSRPARTDYALRNWKDAGLRMESLFRAYVLTMHRSELTVVGHLSERDWKQVRSCVRSAFAE